MPNKEDAITTTIQTYEKIAEEYMNSRSDINIIKHQADYFVKNLRGKNVLDVG